MTKFALALLLAPLAFGQGYNRAACTNDMTAGTYMVSCAGFVTPVPNGPAVPFTGIATVIGDASGFFISTNAMNMIGGFPVASTLSGQATTNPDCTGKITYNKGTPGEMNITFVVISNGDEMRGMIVDKGTNVACQLIRMRR
jgi:hypothetical protein